MKHCNLPDDSKAVWMRTSKTLSKIKTHDQKLSSCLESMKKSIDAGFVEEVPANEIDTAHPKWYLPVFAVDQTAKGKWRIVFDGSYKYKGVSLNSVLVSGPDLNNHLRGVLLRLREKPIAFGSDLQAMFNNFAVPEGQRDFLRFYWFSGNDPEAKIVPYRSTGHNFGLTSSPAVAAFALKFCASQLDEREAATREYLNRSHYVDDGLHSVDAPEEAIEILNRADEVFRKFHINMHKIVSNSQQVSDCFPKEKKGPFGNPTSLRPGVNRLGCSMGPPGGYLWRKSVYP